MLRSLRLAPVDGVAHVVALRRAAAGRCARLAILSVSAAVEERPADARELLELSEGYARLVRSCHYPLPIEVPMSTIRRAVARARAREAGHMLPVTLALCAAVLALGIGAAELGRALYSWPRPALASGAAAHGPGLLGAAVLALVGLALAAGTWSAAGRASGPAPELLAARWAPARGVIVGELLARLVALAGVGLVVVLVSGWLAPRRAPRPAAPPPVVVPVPGGGGPLGAVPPRAESVRWGLL